MPPPCVSNSLHSGGPKAPLPNSGNHDHHFFAHTFHHLLSDTLERCGHLIPLCYPFALVLRVCCCLSHDWGWKLSSIPTLSIPPPPAVSPAFDTSSTRRDLSARDICLLGVDASLHFQVPVEWSVVTRTLSTTHFYTSCASMRETIAQSKYFEPSSLRHCRCSPQLVLPASKDMG